MEKFASQETAVNTPITEIAVNSLITAPTPTKPLTRGRAFEVHGVAWDAGHGLERVDVSLDKGATWSAAQLGTDLGRYSLRPWVYRVQAVSNAGALSVWVRATSSNGSTQPLEAIANPSGYHHNQIQVLELVVA